MPDEHIYSEIWSLIESSRSVVISSHVRVDGDALGSMLALRNVLLDMGKTVRLVHANPVPQLLRFMADWQTVSSPADVPADETYDLGVVLDSGAISRLHEAEPIVRRASKLVNIDHHRDWEKFGCLNLVDTQASAVGEILGELFDRVGADVTPATATALYTSIATDTGGFRYANTTARTHRIAADLIDCGADTRTVNQHLYGNRPLVEFRLLAPVLGTLEQRCGGRVTWMSVDAKMLRETGANLEHVEGLVNYPRSVSGTEIAILFTEIEPGVTKASLRSNNSADVSALAGRFGGGGHYRAAGCTIEAPLDQAREMMLAACRELLGCQTDE